MSITIEPAASLNKSVDRPTKRRIRWSEQVTAYLFLLPALFVFGLFAWFPILKTVLFSFQKVSLNAESTWIGLTNFERMLKDPQFSIAWQNSISFAMLS